MKYGASSKLVEGMWNQEDSDIRVEDAFQELVEKREDVMMELALSSKKELTETSFPTDFRREEWTLSPGSSPRLKPVRCRRGEVVGRSLRG